jgi:hypothetical protein
MEFLGSAELLVGVLGLAGTLAGAAIGWVASLKVYRSQLDDQMLSSALSLLTFLQVAYSTQLAIKQHIDDCIAEASASGLSTLPEPDTLWTRVKPMVTQFDDLRLNRDDLEFLARSKNFSLLEDVITLSMRLPATLKGMEVYSSLQTELVRELRNQSTSGDILQGVMTEDESKRLFPRRLEVNSLLKSVIASLNEDVPMTRRILDRIGPAARTYFGPARFPNVTVKA